MEESRSANPTNQPHTSTTTTSRPSHKGDQSVQKLSGQEDIVKDLVLVGALPRKAYVSEVVRCVGAAALLGDSFWNKVGLDEVLGFIVLRSRSVRDTVADPLGVWLEAAGTPGLVGRWCWHNGCTFLVDCSELVDFRRHPVPLELVLALLANILVDGRDVMG